MEKMIGACGLDCGECDGYKATQANDAAAIERVADEWKKLYNVDVKPEHVWCDGCMAESDRKCAHCGECEIRVCVVGRGLANCAGCDDYACERLTSFFREAPGAQSTLDEIRAARA